MPVTRSSGPKIFHEHALAKINLTLRIAGRRADGYHELSSLVVFAREAFDRLTLTLPDGPGAQWQPSSVTGPEAELLLRSSPDRSNLVDQAVIATLGDEDAARSQFSVTLEKNLPVAAGIGGGSADAAAMLRLLKRVGLGPRSARDWLAIAQSLGADVPVCLGSVAALMSGIGERITPVRSLPELTLLLVNARESVPTGDVFRQLDAPVLAPGDLCRDRETSAATRCVEAEGFDSRDDLLHSLQASGNDLEAPAMQVSPQMSKVREALEGAAGAELVRMSGSGGTWFAIFDTRARARAAARKIRERQPDWWIAVTTVQ